MESKIEAREVEEKEADSGSETEEEQEGESDGKARYFWEEIMERDRQRRDTDRSMNDFMCIKADDYGQMIFFQKRLLNEAGHVLVAIMMDPPGSKGGQLRSSTWEAQRIAAALRCTLANYDDIASCLGILCDDKSIASYLGLWSFDEDEVASCLRILKDDDLLPSHPGSLDGNKVTSCSGVPDIEDDMVFGVLVQTAASQLSLGHSVAIRAPLPHRARIDSLLDIADSTKAKLVVLELREKTWVKEGLSSGYDLDDVPKLVFPEAKSFGMDEEDDHLDFILMATAMNHWHITDGNGSAVEEGGCTTKVKLRHFSHRHPLTLIEQEASTESSAPINYYCDCCLEPISKSSHQYYLCDHCDFSLHKSCTELPQCWEASFHIHPLRLMILQYESDRESRIIAFLGRNRTEPRIRCIVCKQGAKEGPVYRCWSCYAFFIHHQCAMPLTEQVRHECHDHPLSARTSPEVQKFNCYGCGGQGQSVCYSCSECPSDFHQDCAKKLTLAPSIKHRYHDHNLVLTSNPPKDESDEYYCEICAELRHKDHWIYLCERCGYEAHPHCANPDIPPYTMPVSKQSGSESEEEEGEEESAEEGSPSRAESSKLDSDGESS